MQIRHFNNTGKHYFAFMCKHGQKNLCGNSPQPANCAELCGHRKLCGNCAGKFSFPSIKRPAKGKCGARRAITEHDVTAAGGFGVCKSSIHRKHKGVFRTFCRFEQGFPLNFFVRTMIFRFSETILRPESDEKCWITAFGRICWEGAGVLRKRLI